MLAETALISEFVRYNKIRIIKIKVSLCVYRLINALIAEKEKKKVRKKNERTQD